jgi:hypothetical protein
MFEPSLNCHPHLSLICELHSIAAFDNIHTVLNVESYF